MRGRRLAIERAKKTKVVRIGGVEPEGVGRIPAVEKRVPKSREMGV